MIRVFRKWLDQIFPDEEAIILLLLIFSVLLIVVTMGNVLAPFITGLILAFLMQGMIVRLTDRNYPQWLAVTISFLAFIGGFFAIIFIIFPLFWNQATALATEFPRIMEKWQQLLIVLPQNYPMLVNEEQVKEWVDVMTKDMAKFGQLAVGYWISAIPNVLGILIYLVLVPILVFFFLKDRETMLNWVASFLPKERPLLNKVWADMNQQIANYVRGKAIEIVIVGTVSYIAFFALGLNYALVLALLVGFSVLIPYIGAAAVTLPVAMIAYVQWGWGSEFATVLVVYVIIQALDGNVLVPLLFSEAVNLHPVAIILAVLVFGSLWGFWGVFFAIPLATLVKAVLDAWPDANTVKAAK